MNGAVRVAAPAKLNLYLHVTGRRADGYHTLDSLIAFAGLADVVGAAPAPAGEISLEIDGGFGKAIAASVEDNLVLRAARALAATVADAGARLRLTKNIPVAAGLGGGSADAAAALLALIDLWGVDAAPHLDRIALALGADVPVCLVSRPSLVAGIGEVVTPAPVLPDAGLLLVNPGTAVETAAVFAAFDEMEQPATGGAPFPAGPFAGPFGSAAALARALEPARNDLAGAARRLVPAVGEVLAALSSADGCRLARMTGSGATCFGLFDDAGAAEAARRIVVRGQPRWWAWAGGFAARG